MSIYYDRPVAEALRSTQEMLDLLHADLDVERGGCSWWHDYELDKSAVIGIMDYHYGVARALSNNMHSMAVHVADLREQRYVDDLWLRTRARQAAGGLPDTRRNGADARREARIRAHTAGVLRAAGSCLDNLATLVAGIGGMKTNLKRVDLGTLLPLETGPTYPELVVRKRLGLSVGVLEADDPQGGLLRAVRSSLLSAGPEGWLDWTQGSRNDVVHREARMHLTAMTDDGQIAVLLQRQPNLPEAQGMKDAGDITKFLLTEDALSTLDGIVDSINTSTVGSLLACSSLWNRRRDDPSLIVQPTEQWMAKKPPKHVEFNGYRPGTATFGDGIALSPTDVRRWQARQVFDTPAT